MCWPTYHYLGGYLWSGPSPGYDSPGLEKDVCGVVPCSGTTHLDLRRMSVEWSLARVRLTRDDSLKLVSRFSGSYTSYKYYIIYMYQYVLNCTMCTKYTVSKILWLSALKPSLSRLEPATVYVWFLWQILCLQKPETYSVASASAVTGSIFRLFLGQCSLSLKYFALHFLLFWKM